MKLRAKPIGVVFIPLLLIMLTHRGTQSILAMLSYMQRMKMQPKPQLFICPVDLVKGRCLIVRSDVLRRTLSLDMFSKEDASCDDIAICGALAAGRRLRHLVPSIFHRRFKNLAVGKEALAARPDHYSRREAARRRWLMGSVPA